MLGCFVRHIAISFHAFLCMTFHIIRPWGKVCANFLRIRKLFCSSSRDFGFKQVPVIVHDILAVFVIITLRFPQSIWNMRYIAKNRNKKIPQLQSRETIQSQSSVQIKLWETAVRFLHIQLIGTNVWLLKMHNVPPEMDFESSKSPAKSESWNSPSLVQQFFNMTILFVFTYIVAILRKILLHWRCSVCNKRSTCNKASEFWESCLE